MSNSKITAERFILDLYGLALGIWEAARLLDDERTKSDGERKLERLHNRLRSYQQRPFLGDSMRIFFNKEFDPDKYYTVLSKLGKNKYQDVLPDIEGLVSKTREYVDESRRTRSAITRPF